MFLHSQILETSPNRLPSLDGWRAIGIILVLLSHVWATTGGGNVAGRFEYLTSQGDLGVRIFFVVSGFLITHLLLREHETRGHIKLRWFFVRRALRILPVYFTFLAALGALTLAGLYVDTFSSWFGAATFTRNMVGNGRSATGHLWSLAIEEHFYLVWPAILAMFGLAARPRTALLVLTFVILAAIVARAIPCDGDGMICQRLLGAKSTLKYADCLAIGCAGSILFSYAPQRISSSQGLFFAMLLTLGLSTAFRPVAPIANTLLILGQNLLVGACILQTISSKPVLVHALLNSSVFRVIGVLSYSIYIWHMLFLSHYMGDQFAGYLIYDWKVWLLPTLAVAVASFLFLEQPIMKMRRKFK